MTIQTVAQDKQWTVASETKPGTLYIVKRINGAYSCDCDGAFYRGTCKHIKAVAAKVRHEMQLRPLQPLSERDKLGLALLTGKRI